MWFIEDAGFVFVDKRGISTFWYALVQHMIEMNQDYTTQMYTFALMIPSVDILLSLRGVATVQKWASVPLRSL